MFKNRFKLYQNLVTSVNFLALGLFAIVGYEAMLAKQPHFFAPLCDCLCLAAVILIDVCQKNILKGLAKKPIGIDELFVILFLMILVIIGSIYAYFF